MSPRHLAALVVAIVVVTAAAQQSTQKPLPYVAPNSPEKMFQAYCAACHGEQGKGNGPRAASLAVPPPDLTTIAARTGGYFPAQHVYDTIEGKPILVDMGPSPMPAWGDVFMAMDHNDTQVQVRIAGLTRYVQGMQGK